MTRKQKRQRAKAQTMRREAGYASSDAYFTSVNHPDMWPFERRPRNRYARKLRRMGVPHWWGRPN